jgi:hypothetical protein
MFQILFSRRSATGGLLADRLKDIPIDKNVIVNWTGAPVDNLDHLAELVLNEAAFTNKLRQAIRLNLAGVPTITVSLQKEGKEWLPRRNDHQQGFDFTNKRLRRGEIDADFFVKKEEIVDEYRLHVFRSAKDNMRVLRTGVKTKTSPNAHPWVRSHRLGWKLSYVGGASDSCKQAARDAVRCLHLDFGAVDVGVTVEGHPIVLEVNTCPGLDDGGTLDLYIANFVERAV